MKKTIILLLVVLSMSGCIRKDEDYYLNIADIAIGFFRSASFDAKGIDEEDLPAIREYQSTITHVNQLINVSELAKTTTTIPSNRANSSEIVIKDGKCFISYDTLKDKFDEFYRANNQTVIEVNHTLICNGESITLFEDMFYPSYEETQNNPKFDYVLYDYYEEGGNYHYIYRSSYDGTGLKLSLMIEDKKLVSIETSPENIEWEEN